jgi:hypothetical protein
VFFADGGQLCSRIVTFLLFGGWHSGTSTGVQLLPQSAHGMRSVLPPPSCQKKRFKSIVFTLLLRFRSLISISG